MYKITTLLLMTFICLPCFAATESSKLIEPTQESIKDINHLKSYLNNTIAFLDKPKGNNLEDFTASFNSLTLAGLLQEDQKSHFQKDWRGRPYNYYFINQQGKPIGNMFTIAKSHNEQAKQFVLTELKKMHLAITSNQRIVDQKPFPNIIGFGFYGPAKMCTDKDNYANCLFAHEPIKLS